MKINIYQINHERDTHRVAFVDTKYLEKAQGNSAINSKIYDKVFSGNVDCKTLDDVYSRFNTDQPTGYRGRSLSISDVVEVLERLISGIILYHLMLQSPKSTVIISNLRIL